MFANDRGREFIIFRPAPKLRETNKEGTLSLLGAEAVLTHAAWKRLRIQWGGGRLPKMCLHGSRFHRLHAFGGGHGGMHGLRRVRGICVGGKWTIRGC